METDSVLMQWLATYLIHSSVFALLAIGSRTVPALRPAHVQDALLKTALLAGIFSACMQVFTPIGAQMDLSTRQSEVNPWQTASSQKVTTPVAGMGPHASGGNQASLADLSPIPVARKLGGDRLQSAPHPALVFWGLGLLFMSFRLGSSMIALKLILADREPVPRGQLLNTFNNLCAQANLKQTKLSSSTGLSSPVALASREICVPRSCLTGLESHAQQAMLAHEIGHLSRRDPQWQWLFRIVETLLFVQPMNFLLTARLSGLSELLSDGLAVKSGGDRRHLARCLATLAGAQSRTPPRLACPMVGSKITVLERIKRLLENESMNTKETRHSVPILLTGILAGTLLLPGMSSGMDWFKSSSKGTSVEVNGKGSTTRINAHHRDDEIEFRVNAKGQFVFADNDADLAQINDGGWFEMTYEVAGQSHRFEFEGKDGQVIRSYSLNRQERAFDQAAREILAEAMPLMFRTTGIDAQARVGRLLKMGGAARVIEATEEISSDRVMRIYFSSLASQTTMTDHEVSQVIDIMERELSSDLEHRLGLSALVKHQDLSHESWLNLLKSTEQISSDLEQRITLGMAAEEMPDHRDILEAYVRASNSISSDLEQRLSLIALDSYSGFDDATLSRLLNATTNIASDLEQRLTLAHFAEQSAASPAVVDYIDAAREISSDLEARLALNTLLKAGLKRDAAILLVETAAESISSDLELRLLLSGVLDAHERDQDIRRAVRDAAKEMSGHEARILGKQLAD